MIVSLHLATGGCGRCSVTHCLDLDPLRKTQQSGLSWLSQAAGSHPRPNSTTPLQTLSPSAAPDAKPDNQPPAQAHAGGPPPQAHRDQPPRTQRRATQHRTNSHRAKEPPAQAQTPQAAAPGNPHAAGLQAARGCRSRPCTGRRKQTSPCRPLVEPMPCPGSEPPERAPREVGRGSLLARHQ
jgi:hypothetical protein